MSELTFDDTVKWANIESNRLNQRKSDIPIFYISVGTITVLVLVLVIYIIATETEKTGGSLEIMSDDKYEYDPDNYTDETDPNNP